MFNALTEIHALNALLDTNLLVMELVVKPVVDPTVLYAIPLIQLNALLV